MGGSWTTRPVKWQQASSGDEIETTRVRSKGRQRRDLDNAIWGVISAVQSEVGVVVYCRSCVLLALSLSLSLSSGVSPKNHLKVNEMCK